MLISMTSEIRRKEILKCMNNCSHPLSGTELANQFQVSRQVIVQDIALLRAASHDIISTNRGYLLNAPSLTQRVFKVRHTTNQIQDELYSIVDSGGNIKDVFVNHKVYGQLRADLSIHSRRDVDDFMDDIRSGKSSPLSTVTAGYHYHTVEAESENALDYIENTLLKKGYLVI